MEMYCIPIVVLFFNKPKRLESLLTMLSTIEPKTIIFIQNGPGTVDDVPNVFACHEVIKAFTWKGEIIKEFLPKKVDRSAFFSSSLIMALRFVDKAIFLSEDVMPSAAFFEYMEFMSRNYGDNPRIHAVSGTTRISLETEEDYFFSRFSSTAAFMTFARAIEDYTLDISDFKAAKEILQKRIDNEKAYKFIAKKIREGILAFKENLNPENWSYTFLYHLLMNEGLTIFPKHNLVSHAHNPLIVTPDVGSYPIKEIIIDPEFEKAYAKAYLRKPGVLSRLSKKHSADLEI